MTNDRRTPFLAGSQLSRRDALRLGALTAAGAAGLGSLTGCQAVPPKPDPNAAQKRGGVVQPRRHRRRAQGHPRPALPGHQPRHRPLQQPVRAAAVLGRGLHAAARARHLRHAQRGRDRVGGAAARRRRLPQRQDDDGRRRAVHARPGRRPEEHRAGRHRAAQDPRPQERAGGRRQHDQAAAEDPLHRARPAAGGVHGRHHPDRLRHREPGRHGRLQVRVVRPRDPQHASPATTTTGAIPRGSTSC